jgi:hypothetical protein
MVRRSHTSGQMGHDSISPLLTNYVAHAHATKFSLTLMSEIICMWPNLDIA